MWGSNLKGKGDTVTKEDKKGRREGERKDVT